MSIPLRLTVFEGDQMVAEYRFEQKSVRLGRSETADVRLDDSSVGRLHAVLDATPDDRGYELIEMGYSPEGTRVNGERVTKHALVHGDTITLGRFRIEVGLGEVPAVPVSDTSDVIAEAPDPAAMPQPEVSAVPVGSGSPPGVPGQPAASGVYPAPPGHPGASGVYPVPPGYPAAASGVYPAPPGHPGASGVYPMPPGYPAAASGTYPVPPMGHPAGSGAHPAASGSYPAPAGYPGYPGHPTPQGAYAVPAGHAPGAGYPSELPVPDAVSGAYAAWMPPQVPNNLASAQVPEDQRAMEVKLIWGGGTVLDTLNLTEAPVLTMGDERKVTGFGPLQRIQRCDLEVPSRGLPSKAHVLARRTAKEGCVYTLELPPGFTGRIERADGTVVPLELVYAGEHGGEPDGAGGASYPLNAEETVYLGYEALVLQIRYVRRTRVVPLPFFERVNYVWANMLLLAFFIHVVAIGSFVFTPEEAVQLTDELQLRNSRFIETRLALVERQKKEGGSFLEKLESGQPAKAKGQEGRAGKKEAKQENRRLASKGKPDEQEQARRALEKLLGLGGKGAAAGLIGGAGVGGELESAMGGLRGREIGDARGLGGLGTRGTGVGGGGLSATSVGIGVLGTAGRGGGGEGGAGYGAGAADLGAKRQRDIEITAGKTVIRGSLSKEIIKRVIDKHKAQIRYCYEKELQRSPGLFGKVATQFVIDAGGRVIEATVEQNTMTVDEVGRCITAKIRTWKFPKPKGGGIVEVRYPFIFKASG